jgi:hypothetical protein
MVARGNVWVTIHAASGMVNAGGDAALFEQLGAAALARGKQELFAARKMG